MVGRFQIEDVEEPRLSSHQNTINENTADYTISSLSYNTAEAVPMTVYYRKDGEGNTRPTLEDLRQGKRGGAKLEASSVGQNKKSPLGGIKRERKLT